MKKLFAALLQELTAGRGAVLCGIVASRGSTPRGAGAKMLVMEDGSTAGTIGGGAVNTGRPGWRGSCWRRGRPGLRATG